LRWHFRSQCHLARPSLFGVNCVLNGSSNLQRYLKEPFWFWGVAHARA
jgi:hypothetical protein